MVGVYVSVGVGVNVWVAVEVSVGVGGGEGVAVGLGVCVGVDSTWGVHAAAKKTRRQIRKIKLWDLDKIFILSSSHKVYFKLLPLLEKTPNDLSK